jgi:hypothetical protein
MKAKLLLFLGLWLLPVVAKAQTQAVDKQKLNCFATAVAHAEGFGVRHAIPTRYHNPGDLKSRRDLHPLPGQKRLGKGEHVVFASDAAGWAALRDYLSKMVDGRSKRYNPDMTLAQVSRIYAGNWRPWLRTVARELNVEPNVRLRDLLLLEELQAPQIEMTNIQMPFDLLIPQPAPPVLQADNKFDEEDFQY